MLTLFSACAHYALMQLQDDLETNVYQFNKRFEGKMMDLSSAYVSLAKRKDFLIDSNKIREKVTFYDRSVVDIQFLDGDKPVKKTEEGAEKEFDKAIVTLRYQISVLPSNQLKTIMADQVWVLNDEQWQVEPDLSVLLK
jgi:hypothetical protein